MMRGLVPRAWGVFVTALCVAVLWQSAGVSDDDVPFRTLQFQLRSPSVSDTEAVPEDAIRNSQSAIRNGSAGYPDVVLVEHTEERIRFVLEVPRYGIDWENGRPQVTVGGDYLIPREGDRPGLPFRRVHVGIPPNADVAVSAKPLETSLRRGNRDEVPHALVRMVGVGVLRGQRICTLDLHPFQPGPGGLRVHNRLEVTMEFTSSVSAARQAPPELQNPLEGVLRMLLLNYDESRGWRARGRGRAEPWQPPDDAYKVLLDSTGLYELTYEALDAAGVPVDQIDPRTIRLINRGQEQLIRVEGEEDGSFDPGDAVVFWGRFVERDEPKGRHVPFGGRYTETNVYWLAWGGVAGARMQSRSVEPGTPGLPVPQWFPTPMHLEEDNNPFVPNEEATGGDRFGDEWFWEELRALPGGLPVSGTYPFDLPTLAAGCGESCAVRIGLQGYTHPYGNINHHAVLWLNDHKLADVLWGGQVDTVWDSEQDPYAPVIPVAWLQPYGNEFRVDVPGDTPAGPFDAIYTDWFELDHWSFYTATGGRLHFSAPQTGEFRFEVEGFVDPVVELYDLNGPTRLIGAQMEPWGGAYRVVFEDAASETTAYAAWETAHRLAPSAIVEDSPSEWGTPAHGADYLIVSHVELMNAAAVLEGAWGTHDPSVRVLVVDVEDVYDEFNYGVFHPRAIKDLLDYAYHEWEDGAPGHVLLLGDASWDYKLLADDSDPRHRNFVPSWGNPVCDDVIAAIDGDDLLPDYAMGRIAVENADTAVIVAEKLAAYLGTAYADTGQWRNNVLMVADYHGARLFQTQSEQLADSFVVPPPARFNVFEVYKQNNTYYPPGFDSPEGDTVEMYINGPGVATANYLGHGATWTWGTILWDSDIEDDLHNGLRLPFVTSMTCHTGRFANPYIDSFGEIWMWKEDGGAVAFFGTTGWGNAWWDRYQIGYLYRRLFLDQNRRLGDVCLASKVAFADSEGHSGTFLVTTDSPLNFHLLGDPYMKLALAPRPDLAVDSSDIALLPPVPVEGDTVLVTVQVHNLGPDASSEVAARFAYRHNSLWTPMGADVTVPQIPAGAVQSVEAQWHTAGIVGPCSLRIEVDPEDQLFEGWETNNLATRQVTVLERQPDLVILGSDLFWEPEEPDPTQSPMTLGALVRNLGTGQAEGVEVLIALGDSVGMATEAGRDTVAFLSAGDSAAAEALWDIGTGDVGPHWLWVEADPEQQIEELDEGNNVASACFVVLTPPDLAIGTNDILFSNDSPPVGDSITVMAVVSNLGEASVLQASVWFFDQHPDSQGSVPFGIDTIAVAGEAQDTASASWATNGHVGWNTIYVSVDPLDEVEESDEDNNHASRDILVLEAPDLQIQKLTSTPTVPVEGDTAVLTLGIRNAGEVPADSFLVVLAVKSADGVLEQELLRVRQDLAGETSDTLTAAWATVGEAGPHWLVAHLDPDDAVAEANEQNNADSISVTVLTAPDLEVDAWADAETVAVGQTVWIGARVVNLGEGNAEEVHLSLTLGQTLLADSVLGSLAGGSEADAHLAWVGAPVGSHTLLVKATLQGWEPDTLNNVDTVTVTVRPLELPDVVLTASPSDTSLVHGDTLDVVCVVSNTGEQPALDVQLTLLVGENEVGGPSWEVLQPWEERHHIFRAVPPVGDHDCRAAAASSSAESDTTNNAADFRVHVTSRPDLVPVALNFEPAEAVRGDTVQVRVAVRNQGDTDVGFFAVAFFVGDPLLVPVRGVVEVRGGVAAGDSIAVNWPWDTLPDSGAISVTAWLDPNNGVVEESETNNRLAGEASVLPDHEPPSVLFTRGLGGMVVSGELLSPGESLQVVLAENASGIDTAAFKLSLDGRRLTWGQDFVLATPEGLRRGGTISLGMATGAHQVAVDSVFDGCGNAAGGAPFSVEVELSAGLKVRDVMPFPNPSQGTTMLSALCSDPNASGWFMVYALDGTTVARVEASGGGPSLVGEWDGRDRDDAPVANGVYLVRLVATSGREKATSRGRVVVWR